MFLGPPGVGKTHLAVALGIKACEQDSRVLFTTAMALLATLSKALAEHRLEERLKLLVLQIRPSCAQNPSGPNFYATRTSVKSPRPVQDKK